MLQGPIHAVAVKAARLRRAVAAASLAAAMLMPASCARRSRTPVPARAGAIETGIASWYGAPYHGRPTASGEIYDMEKLTAAHKKLPFETWVEVTNLRNGKQVGVRINDRGPFVRGRIIDLSRAAAAEIDMIRTGTDRVRLKVVAAPPGRAASVEARYAVQAGAFEDRSRAEALRAAIGADRARVVDPSGDDGSRLWRVLVGRNLTSNDAARLATEVRRVAGDAIVVRER